MPVHDFADNETGEIISVYVPANAPSIDHQQQTQGGKVYKRVYAAPLAAIDMGTRLGDATEKDFRRITQKGGVRMGDLWEISAAMSSKREQRDGVDAVKEKLYADHERQFGEKHPDVVKREKVEAANRRLAEMGISIRP